jgi:hypothetical protein
MDSAVPISVRSIFFTAGRDFSVVVGPIEGAGGSTTMVVDTDVVVDVRATDTGPGSAPAEQDADAETEEAEAEDEQGEAATGPAATQVGALHRSKPLISST